MSTDKVEDIKQGLVLYTDGGCRPTNPGNIGWGVHGYLFEKVQAKKGSGNPTHILTENGYVSKAEKEKPGIVEVKPICYIDAYGSSLIPATNNVAEIQATANAMMKAKEYDVESVSIYTDSEYVRKGVHEWSPMWRQRNWVRTDGSDVPNTDEWKKLFVEFDALTSRGVKVVVNWVRSHSDNKANAGNVIIGNVMADQLATVGVMNSMKKIGKSEFKSTAADGYWKSDVEKHPFISNRRMYFNTTPSSLIPGEYYLGEHGKDDDLLGKKVSDGAYCVVQLKQPDPVLELLRSHQSDLAVGMDSIVMARLDKLYNAIIYKEILDYGVLAFIRPNPYNLDLNCLDKEPLTKELRPPRLAMRAIEALSQLKALMESYKSKDPKLELTDITDLLYSKEVKMKKDKEIVTTKFKSEYNVGFCALPIVINYNDEGVPTDFKITLTLGIDMLDRNALKRLESLSPKVTIVTWREAPTVFRYATIIESDGNLGIWAGFYSNMVFLPQLK